MNACDSLVFKILAETVEVVRLVPKECGEQPIRQILEETVEVVRCLFLHMSEDSE